MEINLNIYIPKVGDITNGFKWSKEAIESVKEQINNISLKDNGNRKAFIPLGKCFIKTLIEKDIEYPNSISIGYLRKKVSENSFTCFIYDVEPADYSHYVDSINTVLYFDCIYNVDNNKNITNVQLRNNFYIKISPQVMIGYYSIVIPEED